MSFLLEGREVEVIEVWACACSGGHWERGEDGSRDLKCARKGGEYVAHLIDSATREEIAVEIDDYTAPAMVSEWGWRPMGDGMYRRPEGARRVRITEDHTFIYEGEEGWAA